MNQEPELTIRQLQQATSRTLPAAAELDAETAALREDFLQFGRAVEAAGSDFDHAALVAKLAEQADGTPSAATPVVNQRRDWAPLLLSAALAAAALVAIVRTAILWSAPDFAALQPQGSPDSAASNYVAGTESGDRVRSAWSDPLDEEIASAQSAVAGLVDQATGLDGALDSAGWRLRSLFEELESGSL